jgi:hypothetical protein
MIRERKVWIWNVLAITSEEITIKIVLKLWEKKDRPLSEQSDECINFIYNLYDWDWDD